MPMPLFRAVWATALILGAAMRLVGQEKPAPEKPVEPPSNIRAGVELPTVLEDFTVTASRPALQSARWNYSRIDGFEILSSAPEKVTRELVQDFNEFVFALHLISPQLRLQHPLPVTMVICGEASHFRELSSGGREPQGHGSLSRFFHGPDRSLILLNAQAQPLKRADGTIETGEEADRRVRLLYPKRARGDYLRFLLSRVSPALPAWFQEGAAGLYADLRILEDEIAIGRAPGFALPAGPGKAPLSQRAGMMRLSDRDAPNPALQSHAGVAGNESSRGHSEPDSRQDAAPFRDSAALPLAQLFGPAPQSRDRVLWTLECLAFVHWGLHGDNGRHAAPMAAFVERSRYEPTSETLFRDCFQMSYDEGWQALRTHIEFTRAKYFGLRAEKGQKLPRPAPATVRPATPSEIARLKAEAHELAGRPAEARAELIRAYRHGEKDAELLAALGLSDLSAGETARARQFLEAATAQHTRQARAHLALARLRFDECLARRAHPGDKLAPHQIRSILEPLIGGLALAPITEGYSLAAEAWLLAEESPSHAQLQGLISGVQLAPRDQELALRVATLAVNAGDESAASLIALGLKYSATDAQRRRFEVLSQRLAPRKS